MSTEKPPVRVLLIGEVFTRENLVEDVLEIPREKWDAMTPQQRRHYLDDALEQHVVDLFGSGWNLIGEDAGEEVA